AHPPAAVDLDEAQRARPHRVVRIGHGQLHLGRGQRGNEHERESEPNRASHATASPGSFLLPSRAAACEARTTLAKDACDENRKMHPNAQYHNSWIPCRTAT